MTEKEQPQVILDFLNNVQESKDYLKNYGDSGKDRNNGVSLSYQHIAQNDPLFIWFSAGTIGSIQVGKVISFADNPVLSHCGSTNTLTKGFTYGNQEIHNNIVPLYNIYQDYGIDGLNQLKEWDNGKQYITSDVIDAFKIYNQLDLQAKAYADEMHLSKNAPEVIKHVLSQNENLTLLQQSTKYLIKHEQKIVQPMYEKVYFENGKTVGEVLNDVNYLEKLAANYMEWSGAKILDKYISTDNYDLSDYDQRMEFFGTVIDEYFIVLAQEGGFDLLIDQRDTLIAALEVEYIAYGKHFSDEKELGLSLEDILLEKELSAESHAYTWDDVAQKWVTVLASEEPRQAEGVWTPSDKHPELINLVKDYPLVGNTLYQDEDGQSYLFCEAGYIPDPPKGYGWDTLMMYLKPSPYAGYDIGGSLLKLVDISSAKDNKANESQGINPNNGGGDPAVLSLLDVLDFSGDVLNKQLNSAFSEKHQDPSSPIRDSCHSLVGLNENTYLPQSLNFLTASVFEAHVDPAVA